MKLLSLLLVSLFLPLFAASAITEKQPAPASSAPQAQAQGAANTPDANADSDDIRDIRGPISIPYPWIWAVYAAGGLMLLGALTALIFWLCRPKPAKPVPPHEIALQRLEQIKSLMVPERAREYSFAVSEIIREYIENRFGEKAARRTTEEFLRDLLDSSNVALSKHRTLLDDVLRYCDLAKFARWQLSSADMFAMYESARSFILATRPSESSETTSSAGAQPSRPPVLTSSSS